MKRVTKERLPGRGREMDSVRLVSSDTTQAQIQNKGIWKRFFHMCAVARLPYGLLIFYIILTALQGMILVRIPLVNANFFAGDVSVESVSMFIGMELISMVVCQFVLYVNHVVRAKMNRNLRNVLWGKILRLKPGYFERVSASTLISRITVDSDSMNEFVMDILLDLVSQIYMLILTIHEMSRISIRAGLLLLVFIPLSFFVAFLMGRLNLKFENAMKFKMSDLTHYLSELVSCMPLLKAYNRQSYESRRGRQVIDEYYRANRNVVGLDVLKQIVGILVGIGPEICIILLGIKMLGAGTVDAEGWYAFYLYAGTFIGFCNTLCGIWERAKSVQGKLNKVSDVLYEEEESVEPYVNEIVKAGDLMFDNVSFAYGKDRVLDKASFEIPSGKNTVIIGYSGSGKSTILKLLERMYEPSEGRILMGGQEITSCGVREWRRKIAFVTQNTPLLSGSIRENILYGVSRTVTDDEIMEAARLAHVDGFINENPEGLEYQVGQFGARLSGGQRQKLSIARAILTNAEILILDEPTASLDVIAAGEIVNTIEALRGTRTVVTVTHDARAIRTADHIVVVDQGHNVIEGDSQKIELVSDFYRQLVNG